MEGEVTMICQGQDYFLHIRNSFIYSYVYIKKFKIGNKPLDVEFVNIYYGTIWSGFDYINLWMIQLCGVLEIDN
jgi:hypothetical protein